MDLLLRGADLAEGTGAPLRRADIAIERGRIAAIADAGELEPSKAAEVIEARGLLVTPGFIDPHTHYDGQATWDDRLAPSCDHGVTTAVIGNCGVGALAGDLRSRRGGEPGGCPPGADDDQPPGRQLSFQCERDRHRDAFGHAFR